MLPVFVIQPRWFAVLPLGFRKSGPHRFRFLLESLEALNEALRTRGSGLLVLVGEPERLLPALAQRIGATCITAQAEHTQEELDDEKAVNKALHARGMPVLECFESLPLVHPDDLPFSKTQIPLVFGAFRRKIEKNAAFREPLPAPDELPAWPVLQKASHNPASAEGHSGASDGRYAPGLTAAFDDPWDALGFSAEEKELATEPDVRTAFPFRGGEAAGRQRLNDYVLERRLVARYKKTRNGLLGVDYSSKLSAWLANGSLSPRRVHEAVKTYEVQHGGNESTYWLIFELLWRDFFRFQAMRSGDRLFLRGGLQNKAVRYASPPIAFRGWQGSKSGHPFIDANMRELALTGWMSNRGRQNAASWLVRDLDVDWRWGAAWFEHHLLDYDPCSNYGNWQYVAGVGNDPRGDRRFDPNRQAFTYDRQGDYVRTWLPERATSPAKQTLFS